MHLGRVNGGMAHFKGFTHCCGNNDRLSHKERKTRRCIMVQSAQQPPANGCARTRQAGKKGKALEKTNKQRIALCQAGQIPDILADDTVPQFFNHQQQHHVKEQE